MFLDKIMALPYTLTARATIAVHDIVAAGLTSDEINALFANDGAAGEGGALSDVMESVKSWGAGGVSIAQVAFFFVAVFFVIVGAIQLLAHSNKAQERSEDQKAMGWKVVAILFGAGALALVVFIASIANGNSTTP